MSITSSVKRQSSDQAVSKCEQYKYSSVSEQQCGGEAVKDLRGETKIFVFYILTAVKRGIIVSEHLLLYTLKMSCL